MLATTAGIHITQIFTDTVVIHAITFVKLYQTSHFYKIHMILYHTSNHSGHELCTLSCVTVIRKLIKHYILGTGLVLSWGQQ